MICYEDLAAKSGFTPQPIKHGPKTCDFGTQHCCVDCRAEKLTSRKTGHTMNNMPIWGSVSPL